MAALCYAEARGVRRDDARAVELFCRATQVGGRVRTKRPRRRGSELSPPGRFWRAPCGGGSLSTPCRPPAYGASCARCFVRGTQRGDAGGGRGRLPPRRPSSRSGGAFCCPTRARMAGA